MGGVALVAMLTGGGRAVQKHRAPSGGTAGTWERQAGGCCLQAWAHVPLVRRNATLRAQNRHTKPHSLMFVYISKLSGA